MDGLQSGTRPVPPTPPSGTPFQVTGCTRLREVAIQEAAVATSFKGPLTGAVHTPAHTHTHTHAYASPTAEGTSWLCSACPPMPGLIQVGCLDTEARRTRRLEQSAEHRHMRALLLPGFRLLRHHLLFSCNFTNRRSVHSPPPPVYNPPPHHTRPYPVRLPASVSPYSRPRASTPSLVPPPPPSPSPAYYTPSRCHFFVISWRRARSHHFSPLFFPSATPLPLTSSPLLHPFRLHSGV